MRKSQQNNDIEEYLNGLTEDELTASICRASFYEFLLYFWDTIIAEPLIDNWHIKYLCDELQHVGERVALISRGKDKKGNPLPPERLKKEFDYLIINIPPGSSKSTIVSEMYPLWCWTIDPTQRFICGSYASTPAEDIAGKCFDIYNSEKFEKLFPELHGPGTSGGKTNFKNGLKGERYTTSTGSGITGIHAHQKLIDDPMSPAIASSETERNKANTWVSETIGSRNVDSDITVTIIVMQRLHEMDTTGYLLQKEGLVIKHICLPAEASERIAPRELRQYYVNGLFDPVRRSRASLASVKIELGSRGYAGQFEQAPTTPGGNIILEKWFQYVTREQFDKMRNPLKVPIVFFGDTAYTDSGENDPTGLIATCFMDGKLYITAAVKVLKRFPELIKWMPLWAQSKGYSKNSSIRIEPKANGISVIDQLKLIPGLNVTNTPTPKDSKEIRLNATSPKVECGNVVLVLDSWNDEFVQEICGFPNKPHDEYVDLLCYADDYHLNGNHVSNAKELAGFFR